MSGICGVVTADVAPPARVDIETMTAVLERRGPDGTRVWMGGPAALGHTLLATTPEARVETLPLTDETTGCTITADVRLDNREELITALGIEDADRIIGDGELILRAYLQWGDDCPAHLLGDFAFAIWDARSTKLFCARDHMGMRQLIYHYAPGEAFIFATEVDSILTHASVKRHINQARVADFLDDLEGIDFSSTFYEDVFRLPPASFLTVCDGRLIIRRYWTLESGTELKLGNDEAYAKAFLDVFTEAVRCRLRSLGPIGSMLSGGMDSNSITAVASSLLSVEGRAPVQTFSGMGPDLESCVESRTIQFAVASKGYASEFINYSELASFGNDLQRLTDASAEPFDGHMTLIRSVYLAGHRRGVKIMLDGVSGDIVLNAGNQIAALLRSARFVAAIREARGMKNYWGSEWNISYEFVASAWAAFAPMWLKDLRRWTTAIYLNHQLSSGRHLVSAKFAKRVDLADRRKRFRESHERGLPFGRAHRAQLVNHPNLIVARERYDRVAASLAIEPRDPFLDIRVIKFCLSLPASQLQALGWSKVVLRRSMESFLPVGILWRKGKDHVGWNFTKALMRYRQRKQFHLEQDVDVLSHFINRSRPQISDNKTMDTGTQLDLLVLAEWLKRRRTTG